MPLKKRKIDRTISNDRELFKLSDLALVCYFLGKAHADDEGRIEATPSAFWRVVMPYTSHSVDEVSAALAELDKSPYATLYNASGLTVLQFEPKAWKKEQGLPTQKSILPAPPTPDSRLLKELDAKEQAYLGRPVRRVVDEQQLNPNESSRIAANQWNALGIKPKASWTEPMLITELHKRLKDGWTDEEIKTCITHLNECQRMHGVFYKYVAITIEKFIKFDMQYFFERQTAIETSIMPHQRMKNVG